MSSTCTGTSYGLVSGLPLGLKSVYSIGEGGMEGNDTEVSNQ